MSPQLKPVIFTTNYYYYYFLLYYFYITIYDYITKYRNFSRLKSRVKTGVWKPTKPASFHILTQFIQLYISFRLEAKSGLNSIVKNYIAWLNLMEVLERGGEDRRNKGPFKYYLSYLCGRTGNLAPDLQNNAK